VQIDVALSPAEIALLTARSLKETTCVVFDVLRATSSMITALSCGARGIFPVRTVKEAQTLKQEMADAIMGGERHGDLIGGFDVGNNPLDYRRFEGKRIITTTTNGTIGLRNCEHAPRVLVGALLNMESLRETIVRLQPKNLLIVCAGTFETFALEDAYAAGLLVSMLPGAQCTDAAVTVAALSRQFSTPLEALLAARNGRALADRGWKDQVEYCASLSTLSAVGAMTNGVVRLLS